MTKCYDCLESFVRYDKTVNMWIAACSITGVQVPLALKCTDSKIVPNWEENLGTAFVKCPYHHSEKRTLSCEELNTISFVTVPKHILVNTTTQIAWLRKQLAEAIKLTEQKID